ncbi:MAG: IPT/TIG domain-containing protein [Archangium sp.]|nr:IPT/TIG domain-containing protein [Archangium sp.]MDP3151515.1 IPT/TIG domain-containing protein [Archangium sp.]MDP3573945.1 IPT/TIG domain-containing protein [Archangium sp.]
MTSRLLMLFAAILGSTAAAGTKVIKNDTFTGVGTVFTGVSFAEYEGAGVLFEPALSDYPLKIIAIDVLLAPYGPGAVLGQYEFDLWDESAGTVPPPVPNDGGSYYYGRISREARALTPSSSMFNRFTFDNPVIVPSGKLFVKVSQILDTSSDGTTIALDNATTPRPNANWYFDGFGAFHPFEQADGGYRNGLHRNWIIRLVLEVPDVAVTVTSITPGSSATNTATNVVIAGTQFELGARAYLGVNELSLNTLTAQSLAATVPSGLPAGTYDVRVRNPSGVEGVLPNGYRIFEPDGGMGSTGGGAGGGSGAGGGAGGGNIGTETLSLTAITPAQTYAGDATSLFLTGAGFGAGAKVLIGGTRVEGAEVESPGVISASLPADTLTAGTYDVSVINLSGEQATLPQAFKVLAGSKAKPGCSCTQLDFAPLLVAALALIRRRR